MRSCAELAPAGGIRGRTEGWGCTISHLQVYTTTRPSPRPVAFGAAGGPRGHRRNRAGGGGGRRALTPRCAARERAARRGSRARDVHGPAQAPCALPAVDSRPCCPGGVHPRHPARGRPLRVPELARRGPPLTPAVGRAGAGRGGAAAVPAHPAGAREPGRNPAAGPERPAARRRQWERRWRRRWRWRSPGPGGDGRPRHEPRSLAPPCAARGPRPAASASPGPRPGAGDVLPGLRMMVDCQVSAPPGRDRPPHRQGVEEGPRARSPPARTPSSREGAPRRVHAERALTQQFRVPPFLVQLGN